MTAALTFLSALWPAGLPENGRLVLAIRRGERMAPEFFASIDEAAARAMIAGSVSDTYIGMAAQPPQERGRGSTATAIAIPGLWLDLDFEKGFRDAAGVSRFLSALPFVPTMLVMSGGGIHAYWLFEEMMMCADPRAAGLELGWLRYCREVARVEMKANLDAVADLARILRVPGTINFKRTPPVLAEILELNTTRYTPDAFEQWRIDQRPSSAPVVTFFDFVLREDAQPPFSKWELAKENDPELEAVFNHKKKMPTDNSVSGYDLSLATRLDALDWTAQEIVDTIIAHRVKWQDSITDPNTRRDPLKMRDPGYYERLLRKARASNNQERISAAAVELAESVSVELSERAPNKPVEPNLRTKWFQAIQEITGMEVVDLWAVDRLEGKWFLRVRCFEEELRDFPVFPVDRILQWAFWKTTIMASGANVEKIPKKEPPSFSQLISKAGIMLRVLPRMGNRTVDELVDYLVEIADNAPSYESANVAERESFRRIDNGPVGLETWGGPEECIFTRIDTMFFDSKTGRIPKNIDNLRHTLVGIGFVPRVVAARTAKGATTTRNYLAIPISRLKQLQRDAGVRQTPTIDTLDDTDDPQPLQ